MNQPSPARPPVLALSLCYGGMAALAIAINLIPVFLTTLSTDLGGAGVTGGLTQEQQGRLGAATFISLVAAILLTGPLADRLGPRRFVVLGSGLLVSGLAVLGVAHRYATVVLACALMGAGAGILDMVLSSLVSALAPARRAVYLNLLHAFYCLGAAGTILLAALALRWGVSWRIASLLLLALPLVVGLGFVPVRLPSLVAQGQDRMRLRHLVFQPYYLVTLLVIFLGGATEISMTYWLASYGEKSLGFSKFASGMAFLAFALFMAAGRLGIGFWPGNRGAKPIRIMAGGCVGLIVLLATALWAPWPAVALGACVLSGLMVCGLWPCTLAVAADRFPHGGASMMALLAAWGNFGGAVGPWLVGKVADQSSLRWGLACSALAPLLILVCLGYLRRHGHPPHGPAATGAM